MSNRSKLWVQSGPRKSAALFTLYLAEEAYLIVVLKRTMQLKNKDNYINFLSAIHVPYKYFKIKPSFMSDANLIIKSASWCMNLWLFFACVYLKEIENYLMLLGVCDWYTLLKTPHNMVSIPSTIFWGKVVLCDRMSCVWVSFPLIIRAWSSCEWSTPSKQISSPPLASINIPGHSADYFPPYWPGRSQVPDIVTG